MTLGRALILAAALLALYGCDTSCTDQPDGLRHCTFTREFEGRSFRLRAPSAAMTHPLVVMLHGGGQDETSGPNDIRTISAVESSVSPDTVIVYPHATGTQWNLVPEACDLLGLCDDDVAYVNAVLYTVAQMYALDPTRAVLAGHSGGAFIALRMACEPDANPGQIALVAMAATLSDGEAALCASHQESPLVMLNGTEDGLIQYGGATFAGVHGLPVVDAAERIVQARVADPDAGWGFAYPPAEVRLYDADVTLVTLNGWGHGWHPFATLAVANYARGGW